MGIAIIIAATVLVTTILQRGLGGNAAAPAAGAIALPAGARVVETRMDGGRVLMRLSFAGGKQRLLIVDAQTGARLALHDLVTEGAKP
jgi:hypothetical protein